MLLKSLGLLLPSTIGIIFPVFTFRTGPNPNWVLSMPYSSMKEAYRAWYKSPKREPCI